MIKIIIDGIDLTCADVKNAINALYEIEERRVLSKSHRCHKCVYENTCTKNNDINGSCTSYRRDPPDGGYYG